MNTVNRIAISALFGLLVATPFAQGTQNWGQDASRECVIDAAQWGRVDGDDISAAASIDSGIKPVTDDIFLYSDASYIDTAFVLFELPYFKGPVLFGKLRIEIEHVRSSIDAPITLALHDVIDLPLLLHPYWTLEEWETSLNDLASGRVYGDFSVHVSPADDGILEVPLSYDAMFDINAAAGAMFAIGFANGEGWLGDGEQVIFRKPSDGGVVQLVLTQIGVDGKPRNGANCSKFSPS